MFQISKNASLYLSMALSVLALLALILCAVYLPMAFLRSWIEDMGISINLSGPGGWKIFLCMGYAMILTASLADGMLLLLLIRVKRHLVFTEKSLSLIRGVSWCCFLFGALGALAGILLWKPAALLLPAAALMGLCLRVVKNVLEEAMAFKAENDLTV